LQSGFVRLKVIIFEAIFAASGEAPASLELAESLALGAETVMLSPLGAAGEAAVSIITAVASLVGA
jgi:hypothetical protein